ncbi:hypothetical protein [Streptomyces sp. NPDC007991]|uniref:hypothetical protein n=1 Tax=Streptomyces sp. NPDC007991 TaxID=3364803 RepID=UPI0036E4D26E
MPGNWTATVPTPPVAPSIATVSPGTRPNWVGASAGGGDTERAAALFCSLTRHRLWGEALVAVVEQLAREGETGRAQALVLLLTHRPSQVTALITLGGS